MSPGAKRPRRKRSPFVARPSELGALLAELDHEGWEARDVLTVLAVDDAWVGRND